MAKLPHFRIENLVYKSSTDDSNDTISVQLSSHEKIITFHTGEPKAVSYVWTTSSTVPPSLTSEIAPHSHPGFTMDADVIRNVVSRFHRDDLSLLHKVLESPSDFGLTKIAPGAYYIPDLHRACIIGALAIAKLPLGVAPDIVVERSQELTDEGFHPLSVLDAIISRGHLPEFIAEIERQLVSR